eukprot:gene11174-18787_t
MVAGDTDRDGLINLDEFHMILKLAAPDVPDRVITKMYSEAVRCLPHGQHLIDTESFVRVARVFGLDRWKIDSLVAPYIGNKSLSTISSPPINSFSGRHAASAASNDKGQNLFRLLDGALDALLPTLEDMIQMLKQKIMAQAAAATTAQQALDALHPTLEDMIQAVKQKLMAQAATAAATTARQQGLDTATQRAAAQAASTALRTPSPNHVFAMPHGSKPTMASKTGGGMGGVWPCRGNEEATMARLEALMVNFQEVYKQRDDANLAWLSFRILYSSLQAALK